MKLQRLGPDDPAIRVAKLWNTSETVAQLWDDLQRCRTAWAELQPASALASFDGFEDQRLARQEMETAALRFGLALADAAAFVVGESDRQELAAPEFAEDNSAQEVPADGSLDFTFAAPLAVTTTVTAAPAVDEAPTVPLYPPTNSAEPSDVTPTHPVAPVPQAPPVQLSAGHLQRLQAHLSGSAAPLKGKSPAAARSPDVAGPAIRRDEALEEVYRLLGRLTNSLRSVMEVRGEAGLLAKATQQLNVGLYGDLDSSDRHIIQRWIAIRWQIARAAAQQLGDDAAMVRLQETARVCQQLRERYPTAFAHGWGKDHTPTAASWREDLAQLEVMVQARLGRFAAVSSADVTAELKPRVAAKARTVDSAVPTDDNDDIGGQVVQLGADDPLGALTHAKTALLVGGDARVDRIPRIQAYFGFRELEWLDLPENDARRLPALENRITSGKWDYCIVLQKFSRHRISELVWATCARSSTKAVLSQSYGIQALRRGLARYLGVA